MSEKNNDDLFIIVALLEEWVTRLRSIEFIANDFTILHSPTSPTAIANRLWSSKQPKRTIVLERKYRDQQRHMELYRVVIRAKLSGLIYTGFYFNELNNESTYRHKYWNLANPDLLNEIVKIIETWPDVPSAIFSPISEFLNSLDE